jgi:hypothetical protein
MGAYCSWQTPALHEGGEGGGQGGLGNVQP